MATYASLTPEQQAQVQDVVQAIRSASAELARIAARGRAVSAAWNGGTSTIVASLDPTEVIPNAGGLAGAQGLAPADVTNLVGYLIDLSNPANNQGGGGYNTAFHQALYVKAAGINATLTT